MTKILISIIVPCYNQAQYLPEALQSVLDQTYSDWECIIVNDGSPDDTDIVAKEWLIKDIRFKYIYKENGGLSSARNAGIEIAIGDFIQFLDADDYLDPRKLELSINAVLLDAANNIIITNFRMFDSAPNQSSSPYCKLNQELFVFETILFKWENTFSIPIHCGLFHISLIKKFRFPENLKAKEDWIMWLFVFQQKVKVFFIDESLSYYRRHEQSMTQNQVLMSDAHNKAIAFIQDLISTDLYIRFLKEELQRKNEKLNKLSTSIYNYQNSRSYKLVMKCKNNFIVSWFITKIRF
tara:strand:+ start:2204 stop:3088 length:885 start_codon:yes stop_codon:yes gene_type:complete